MGPESIFVENALAQDVVHVPFSIHLKKLEFSLRSIKASLS